MRTLLPQLARFGTVGLVGLGIDIVVFNVLRLTVLAPEHLHEGPVIAKVLSTAVAAAANWIGNRHWTFAEHRRPEVAREAVAFFTVSIAGMAVSLICLWFSHYVLGLTSPVADNISTNVIGLGLGTALRFSLYKWWVYAPRHAR